jgi:LmbE family N-acetylglucosaminyl deacetylase
MNPFEPPDIFEAKRILAVQPHYDDNDIAAGGTLAALVENGAELFYLTVTDDLVGVIDQSLTDEQMTARLRAEQDQAGAAIGVSRQYWLGYPDAGKYDYFDVRRDIMTYIRKLRPDFIFTCDPWLPYESHTDHILTGRAVAEAVSLYGLTRLTTEPAVDKNFEPFDLIGIAFYATAHPNTIVDISRTYEKKHEAINAYRAQFSVEDLEQLHFYLSYKEQDWAKDKEFSHGEPLKVLRRLHLHFYPDALNT